MAKKREDLKPPASRVRFPFICVTLRETHNLPIRSRWINIDSGEIRAFGSGELVIDDETLDIVETDADILAMLDVYDAQKAEHQEREEGFEGPGADD